MTLDEIREALANPRRHACAKCVSGIPAASMRIYGREGGGTRMRAQHHGHNLEQVIPDVLVEDGKVVLWFLDEEGTPYETAAQKRKRLLLEEINRVRAARREQNDSTKEQP